MVETASELPVARVVVDLPLPHLDRPFDYTVPASMSERANPGVRVKVRFAGQDVDGFILERVGASDHGGRLSPLRRVVSAEQVLTPEVFRLARAVADRYAGTLSDVLRLAVPPRHAQIEGEAGNSGEDAVPSPGGQAEQPPEPGPWADYAAGPAFVHRLAGGQAPRAVWTALPGQHWAEAIATAVAATLASGRGVLVVLPDRRDVDTLEAVLVATIGPGRHARLEADLGPAARYRAYLALLRNRVRVAVGTRAAAFAPVSDLGLAVLWEDGDDSHVEPRAPYPQAREVLVLRSEQAGAAMLLGGWSRTAEAAQLVADGWARPIEATREVRRARWPRVVVAADSGGEPAARQVRMPTAAWRAVHDGLVRGPVLVQVPRAGYLPGLGCRTCRSPARCPHCHGHLLLRGPGGTSHPTAHPTAHPATHPAAHPATHPTAEPAPPGIPECAWCGRALPGWTCPACGGRGLRARSVGVERTAEELGRAFPGSRVAVSRAGRALPVPGRSALVLATPGLEPAAAGGYAAAVLLDGDLLLERPDLRAGEEALRRWRAAVALVRPASAGGLVVVCADPAASAVQALVRSDPGGHADRELTERRELGLPPTVALATVTGDPAAVQALLDAAELPEGTTVLGPAPLPVEPGPEAAPGATEAGPPPVRAVLRAPRERAGQLSAALSAAGAVRSARRDPGRVRVRVDARDVG